MSLARPLSGTTPPILSRIFKDPIKKGPIRAFVPNKMEKDSERVKFSWNIDFVEAAPQIPAGSTPARAQTLNQLLLYRTYAVEGFVGRNTGLALKALTAS